MPYGLFVRMFRMGFKCPTRSTLQIRCRRTALRARRSRIRANADYRKALDSHPSERTAAAATSIRFTSQLGQSLFFGQARPAEGTVSNQGAFRRAALAQVRDYVPAKCEVAHTLASPSNSTRTDTRTCQEGTHGTETNIS